MSQPLRSISITETSSLLRVGPPLCPASVLSCLWDLHLHFSLSIRTTGSHVPYKSLTQSHAISMPEAAQAVNRFPLNLSRSWNRSSVLTSSLSFRHLIEWFAYARLSEPHLPRSSVTFPKRSPPWLLTKAALGGLKPNPATRLRGALPHLLYSYTYFIQKYARGTLFQRYIQLNSYFSVVWYFISQCHYSYDPITAEIKNDQQANKSHSLFCPWFDIELLPPGISI